MPKKLNSGSYNYEHWYNFIVPEERSQEFTRKFQVMPNLKTRIKEEPGRKVIDVLFQTKRRETPVFVAELMNDFDGVEVYEAQREKH